MHNEIMDSVRDTMLKIIKTKNTQPLSHKHTWQIKINKKILDYRFLTWIGIYEMG